MFTLDFYWWDPWRFPVKDFFIKKLLNQTISSQDFSNQISYLTRAKTLHRHAFYTQSWMSDGKESFLVFWVA